MKRYKDMAHVVNILKLNYHFLLHEYKQRSEIEKI